MAAPMKKKKAEVNESKGRRYTENKKAMVLAWIKAYNKGHGGRGGEFQAMKHFGISGTAIRHWQGKTKVQRLGRASTTPMADYSKLRAAKQVKKAITVMQLILKSLS